MIRRRDFLRAGAAFLAGSAVAGPSVASDRRRRAAPVDLTFAFGPDDSGTLQPLIDRFNAEHEGDIRVTWTEMERASDAFYRQMQSDFEAGAANYDVIGADVVWTAPLVEDRRIRNLSSRFHDTYEPEDFVEAALQSAAYRFRIWGVPWYTDAGVLFYRRDLLDAVGIDAPPQTWDALREQARRVMDASGTPHGFVFQGDAYEGGVANALEYVWNAGGRVMTLNVSVAGAPGQNVVTPNLITVNSEDAALGFDAARQMITDGVTPPAVTTFREEEAWTEFLEGRAVFMRNWPYVYGLLAQGEGTLDPTQVGVTTLPALSTEHTSYSCLGGWNLMVNADAPSERRDAAWTFIQYMTSPAVQRERAVEGGFLPTRSTLYDDADLKQAAPGVALGRAAVAQARVRPVSPHYLRMSPRIARAFTRTLRGDLTGREAVRRLQDELRSVLRAAR